MMKLYSVIGVLTVPDNEPHRYGIVEPSVEEVDEHLLI
jgi:UTP-glucose-1-phosphate uridylyltransferase